MPPPEALARSPEGAALPLLDPVLLRLLAGAGTIALFHAVLPTHWLPFALVGRAQGWRIPRRALVGAAAAAGHAAITAVVGLAAALAGRGVGDLGLAHAEEVGGALLLVFGLLYAALDIRHLGHRHSMHHVHDGEVHDSHHHGLSDRTAVASLILLLSVSPCVALVPIFFEAGTASVRAAALVAAVNAAVTVPCMAGMVALGSIGIDRLRLERLERYERALVGALLVALGIAALALHRD
jgi:hypothetical protein